ncbi:MAG: threonine synthase [Peptococcaceae bacterium]|nr:threonine synthase [Peptococcaceae bacterium]
MQFFSTRGEAPAVSAAEAISRGLAPDGGLYVPETFPQWQMDWAETANLSYQALAEKIFALYLSDYSADEIKEIVKNAYGSNFAAAEIAPLVGLSNEKYLLELWHGPTAAFKDMALQALPHLMQKAVAKTNHGEEVIILTATSGDTGKAALEGFKNVDGIKIIVFYPQTGVSEVQKLQMLTTEGNNTYVVGVDGNFDHCQKGVKEIFSDGAMNDALKKANKKFSSANSINWGRLMPQIVYYFWSYCQLLKQGALKAGEPMGVVVPTGNFGNILAAYYGMRMGLPVGKFVCASNENKVLTDVINSGTYDKRREFYKTTSPSMDILVSSNFERFLYEMCGRDAGQIRDWFQALATEGVFTVDDATKANWQKILVGGFATQGEINTVIADTWIKEHYVLDPHTAVGVKVCGDYQKASGETMPMVIASTASPFKFAEVVYGAISGEGETDSIACLAKLSAETGWEIPAGLRGLTEKAVRHNTNIDNTEMAETVKNIVL